MAFQESGFDQSKVSPEGAVGIMQVRPDTAADPQVGIPDISSVENNIQAGVKYLKFLQDQYFDDAAILPRDQVRFSLAAYNAGPVRMRQARKKALNMHLDPNRWFRNVEIAMLKIVGQETVRYVSNINKYYVIYNNAYQQVEKREAAIQRIKK
jgi:membrane-bound lytic murein transglycosylase MltF